MYHDENCSFSEVAYREMRNVLFHIISVPNQFVPKGRAKKYSVRSLANNSSTAQDKFRIYCSV